MAEKSGNAGIAGGVAGGVVLTAGPLVGPTLAVVAVFGMVIGGFVYIAKKSLDNKEKRNVRHD